MNNILPIFIFVLVPVAGIAVAYLLGQLSSLNQRQKKGMQHTVIAEYEAPTWVSPAELGYIFDAKFGSNELLATIADLYSKDLVQLKPLTSDDFSITAIDPKGSTDDSDSSVLGYLRSLPGATSTWKQFDSMISDSVGPQADFKEAVLGSLVGKELLNRGMFAGILQRDKRGSMTAATVLLVACLLAGSRWLKLYNSTGTSAGYTNIDNGVVRIMFVMLALPLWFLLFAYTELLSKVYTHQDGIPFGATKSFRALWPEVAGFQLFLRETEYVRLQHDLNPRDPAMAYCLALGLDPGFAKSLDQL